MKLSIYSNKKLAALSLLISQSSFAVPTLYPKAINELSNIVNPTQSNLLADDTDSKAIWVMPPNEGYGTVSSLHTLGAGLTTCGQIRSAAANSEALEAKIQQLRLQMADKISTLEDFDKKITLAKEDAAKYATNNHLIELLQIDGDLMNANASLLASYQSLQNCQPQICNAIATDISMRQKQISELTQARTRFLSQNLATGRIYDQKNARVIALVAQKDQVLENYQTLITKLSALQNDINSVFTTYSGIYGARASFNYQSGWNENVDTLRRLNPSYTFSSIPTASTVIYSSVTGVVGLKGRDAVMAFEIGGEVKPNNGVGYPSYPASLTGNIALSVIGACPMVVPNFFKFAANTDPANMKYGMMATYEFPTNMKLSMRATYNMYKLYQIVKQSGSSGGLFRSRSWSTTEERNYFRDGFRVDWTIQDSANTVTDEQRIVMERDARTQIFSRLMSIAIPQTPDKALLASALPAPTRGSIVIADSLMTACPGNVYCLAGAFILKGLDSIFGSSTSTSNYTNIQDIDLVEEWNVNKTVMKPWITNFKM